MSKYLIASSLLAVFVAACSISTDSEPEALRISPGETLEYLRGRLVGWEARDGDSWVRYDAITLADCMLIFSQSRNTKSGIHTLHHEYPLNLLGEADWFPTLGASGVLMVSGRESAAIRLRWNREASVTYMMSDQLDLPPEYGERITKAFNHLRRTCVPKAEDDPFQ